MPTPLGQTFTPVPADEAFVMAVYERMDIDDTLYDFDIYPELGDPAGSGNPTTDVEGWKQSIIS